MVQYEQTQDGLMKLIWLAIEPDIQDLVDRELGNFSRIPEYHKPASELIRLRSQRRATSERTCQN
jgi:hypothetical protein